VAFETDFGPDLITGSIPLEKADLKLDFDNVANCTVDVALDVTGAKASFPFAAQALKGPKVLAARDHPRMTFESTSVRRTGEAADVTGNLTIRGVTRAVTLRAQLFRPQGSGKGDLDHLTVTLTGKGQPLGLRGNRLGRYGGRRGSHHHHRPHRRRRLRWRCATAPRNLALLQGRSTGR
jgi:polyisoprenoid-binding protein YceI